MPRCFPRRGYLIPKSQIHDFYRYTQRTMISIFIGLAATVLLGMNAFDGFFAGLAVYLVWTGYFSARFFNQLATVEPFQRPKKENYFITLSRKYSGCDLLRSDRAEPGLHPGAGHRDGDGFADSGGVDNESDFDERRGTVRADPCDRF